MLEEIIIFCFTPVGCYLNLQNMETLIQNKKNYVLLVFLVNSHLFLFENSLLTLTFTQHGLQFGAVLKP